MNLKTIWRTARTAWAAYKTLKRLYRELRHELSGMEEDLKAVRQEAAELWERAEKAEDRAARIVDVTRTHAPQLFDALAELSDGKTPRAEEVDAALDKLSAGEDAAWGASTGNPPLVEGDPA